MRTYKYVIVVKGAFALKVIWDDAKVMLLYLVQPNTTNEGPSDGMLNHRGADEALQTDENQ